MPKVYVGNLASSVTSRDLQLHFARAGEVVGALAVTDKASGTCLDSVWLRWLSHPTSRLRSVC